MAVKTFLDSSKDIGNVILFNIKNVAFVSDIAIEIIILFDQHTWFSLLWNPVKRHWRMEKHVKEGWIRHVNYSTEQLLNYIYSIVSYVSNINAVVCRTNSNKKIYLRLNN